jgi:transposase
MSGKPEPTAAHDARRAAMESALRASGGNVVEAASTLNINYSTAQRWLSRYDGLRDLAASERTKAREARSSRRGASTLRPGAEQVEVDK